MAKNRRYLYSGDLCISCTLPVYAAGHLSCRHKMHHRYHVSSRTLRGRKKQIWLWMEKASTELVYLLTGHQCPDAQACYTDYLWCMGSWKNHLAPVLYCLNNSWCVSLVTQRGIFYWFLLLFIYLLYFIKFFAIFPLKGFCNEIRVKHKIWGHDILKISCIATR